MSKFKILSVPSIFFLAGTAFASPPPTDEETKKQLPGVEDTMCRANVAFDGPFFEKLTAAEAIFTFDGGNTMTRDDVLAPFHSGKKPAFKLESCVNEDVVVRPLGTAAVVTGIVTVKGTGPNGPYTDRSRYTQTMAWRDGRWQLVAAHGSHLPDKK